ncbi:MAG: right-handed parallel beta-helix repeat-containing protein, partial [Calditrichaeota bacterium]|nr:right-handed parallel beta-helix repeat-containing protein [Calditrichota bacterium]
MALLPSTRRRRLYLAITLSAGLALLSSCLEIDQVHQPRMAAPGDTLTVTLEIHSQGTDPNPHAVFVTVLVPNDWQPLGATYQSQKYGSGEFLPSQYWADSCEVVHPSGPDYKWVGFLTPRGFLANEERIDATVVCMLQVGPRTGDYQLAYTLGEDALGYDTSWGDVYDAVFGVPISVVTHLEVPQDYPSVQAAVHAAEPGMVVLVHSGVYVEHVQLEQGVTLQGDGPGKTVLLAADPAPTVRGAEGAVLSALTIVNNAAGGTAVQAEGAHHMRLNNVEVVVPTLGIGVVGDSATGLSIEDAVIRANGGSATGVNARGGDITLSGSRLENLLLGMALTGSRGDIRRNLFVGCDSAAVLLTGCPATTVMNNTVDRCGYGVVAIASVAEVFNNIIARSRGYGVWTTGELSCRYNDLWQNVGGDYFGCAPGEGAIAADPRFVGGSPFDYHLAPGSPCIDAGDPAGPRDPDGTVADLGAFPFQQPGIASSINYVYLIHFTHLDIGFTDPQDEVAERYKGIIDRAIQFAETIPDYKWTIESVWQLEQWLARSSAADVARLQRLVDAGKMHLCAGYANMHTAVLGSEEINRFLYPAERYRRQFGFQANTVLQNDVPGFSWWMPTVLANAGVRYFAAGVNQSFGGSAQIPRHHNPFYWQGPDGQKILTWISRGSYMEWLSTYSMGNLTTFYQALENELQAYQAAGYPYDAILIMVGSLENTYPTTLITSIAQAWNQRYANPKLIVAGPDEFFAHLEEKYGQQFATYRGDWAGGWDLVSLNVPQSMGMNRQAHDLAIAAEKVAAVNELLGIAPSARDAFDAVYANMLQFDEHSGGGAPWPELMTPQEAQRQSEIAVAYARDALTGAQSQLQQGLQLMASQVVSPEPGIVVFNPLSWERSDAVRVELDAAWRSRPLRVEDALTGCTLPHQWLGEELMFSAEQVPPLGYRLFFLRDSSESATAPRAVLHSSSPAEVENEFFRVRVDPSDGRVVSLFDKRHGRELVNAASP